VVFRAVEQFRFEGLRKSLRCIVDRDCYDRCGKFIVSLRRKITSASVVAELNCWIRETERAGQGKLWNRVYEEFDEMRMDEQVVKLLEMDIKQVAKFGPTDVSLIDIARRSANLSPVVLTADRPLLEQCGRAGLRVKHLKELTLPE